MATYKIYFGGFLLQKALFDLKKIWFWLAKCKQKQEKI